MAFQHNSSWRPLLKVSIIHKIAVRTLFLLRKHYTRSLNFLITQENYLIIIEHVDKLSRRNIYLRKVLGLDLKIIGLQIWITIIRFYWILTWQYLDCDCQSVKPVCKLIDVNQKHPHVQLVNNRNTHQHDFTKPFSVLWIFWYVHIFLWISSFIFYIS